MSNWLFIGTTNGNNGCSRWNSAVRISSDEAGDSPSASTAARLRLLKNEWLQATAVPRGAVQMEGFSTRIGREQFDKSLRFWRNILGYRCYTFNKIETFGGGCFQFLKGHDLCEISNLGPGTVPNLEVEATVGIVPRSHREEGLRGKSLGSDFVGNSSMGHFILRHRQFFLEKNVCSCFEKPLDSIIFFYMSFHVSVQNKLDFDPMTWAPAPPKRLGQRYHGGRRLGFFQLAPPDRTGPRIHPPGQVTGWTSNAQVQLLGPKGKQKHKDRCKQIDRWNWWPSYFVLNILFN